MASVLQHGKVVQIRSRAVFNLPERYQYVSLNVCSKKGHPWSSNTTAVVRQKGGEGTALIDFWARLPADNGDTSIEIELHPEPKPGKFKLFEKSAYAEKRRTTLRVPHTFPGPGEPPVWHRAVISLEPKLHTHTQIAAKIKNDLRRIDSVVHGGAREVTATLGRHHERLANTVMGGGLPRAAAGIEMVPVPEGRQGEEGAPASTSGPPVSGPVSNASLAQRPSHWEVVSSAVGEQPSMLSITPVMDHDAGEIVNIEDFDIPPPEAGAVILVEFCAIRLDRGQARLPELELGKGLHRSLHCYAHGGFMGCALSLLADPEWEYILLSAIEDQEKANSRKIQMAIDKKVVMAMGVDGLSPATTTLAKKEELIFMNVLENSPTLCAYGLTRSGCCGPAMAVSDIPPAPSQAPSLASTWWMSHRPNSPIDPPIDVDSLPEDHVWQIFPTVPKARRPNLLLETHRCVWSPAGDED
ncbi:hypothetical protein FOA52_003434 [Chlamydomonas sp. UWO 241]|nr:hypothetical protein FOA52_003434 [Chlamydomonas sp. UWO 241]